MKRFSSILIAICVILGLVYLGCKKDNSIITEVSSQHHLPMYSPKGTISGKVIDACSNAAVSGAVVSTAYNGNVYSTTTDASGSFSFAYVPAGSFQTTGGAGVVTGTYSITVSLVNYNAKTDSLHRYRNYYYSTVTVTFTTATPGDSLVVNGLVGSVTIPISMRNTTVEGTVVDQNMQPVSNAIVTLWDESAGPNVALYQTTSGAAGNFKFTSVDNGLPIKISARSSDGSLEGSTTGIIKLPCNVPVDSLRSQDSSEQVVLRPSSNVAPMVAGITPQNGQDISPTGLQIVYLFSEPIKQTPYTRTDLGVGYGTMMDNINLNYNGLKKTTSQISLTASWNASFTQLTITPSNVVGSARYSFSMVNVLPKLTNNAGDTVVNNKSMTGDFETLNFTTSGNSPVPAAPVLTRRMVPGLFGSLDYNGGAVGLEWNYDPNARSYNIYRSTDGGPFLSLSGNVFSIDYKDSLTSLVYPAGALNPLRAISAQYQVRCVSADLVEGPASNILTVSDGVSPRLISATESAAPLPAPPNTWIYILQFSEPMSQANAEAIANYSFTNSGSVTFAVTQANYLGYNTGTTKYHVQLVVTTNLPLPVGYNLIVGTGVTDLAGNSIDPNFNMWTF